MGVRTPLIMTTSSINLSLAIPTLHYKMKVTANALPKHMTQFIDPQPTPEAPSSLSELLAVPVPPATPALIAPLWHTLLITALILGNSFLGSSKVGAVHGSGSRILLYGGTFITQLVL